MSNNYPTLNEVAIVVEKMNNLFECHAYNNLGKENPPILFEIHNNGFETNITCLGTYVWNSTDDMRETLYEEENPCEPFVDVNGGELKEKLEDYLIKGFKKIKMCLLGFNV